MTKSIHFIFLLILFISTTSSIAQTQQKSLAISVYEHESEQQAKEVIQKIVDVVGLKANFEIRAGNVPNAAAIISNGKRFIIYNPEFMKKIHSTGKTEWGGIGILAHEVGHHLNGHTLLSGGSRHATELEADEFVGFVLRKMGATIIQAKIGIAMSSQEKGTRTHPPRSSRMASIEAGWKQADAQMAAYGQLLLVESKK
jgi:outer membrane lipoprotein-sorting protein